MNHPNSGITSFTGTTNQNAVGRYSSTPATTTSTNPYSIVNNSYINHPSGTSVAASAGAHNLGRGNIPTAIRRPPFVDPTTNIVYDVNDPDYEGWLYKQSQWLKVMYLSCIVSAALLRFF
jgi:hypothetical protein